MLTTTDLATDAKNRSLRTFLTGMTIDVGVAVALLTVSVLSSASGWGDLEWLVLSFSFAKSIIQAVASYILRRYLDTSKFPTPVPPTPPNPITPQDV